MPRANIPISPDHHSATELARPRLLAHCALTFLVGSLIIASPSPAQADGEHDVSGGRLDWGLRDSFVNYISGPIAKGNSELTEGLSTHGGEFRFHSADGTYTSDGELTISYQGRVHFTGHEQDDGSFELDLAISNPTVEVTNEGATLYVDIDRPDGTFEQAEFAELSLDAASLSGQEEAVSASDIAATLTAEGAESFAGFYEAGEELNPLSFSGDLAAPAEEPAEDEGDELPHAVLDWGVRDSWRDFVTGDIADGGWTVNNSAEDGGAVFRFIEAEPRTAADDIDVDDLELAFDGELSFWGENVDLTVTDPHLVISDDHGEIAADVDDERVTLATFTPEWSEADGQARLDGVPTELAEEAVDLFHGFYQAGDAMDPVTVIIPLEAEAAPPDLPDLGSEPLSEDSAEEETTDDQGLPWALIAAIAGGVVALLGLLWLVSRMRSTSTSPTDEGDSPAEPQAGGDASSDSSSSTPAPDSQKTQETE